MSQVEPQPKPRLTCWDCGATNDPGASECWLCQRRDWRSGPATIPKERGAFPRRGLSQLSIAVVIVAGGLLLVHLAMVINFQILLLFLIVLVPVGLIIWARAGSRSRPVRGQLMTRLEVTAAWTVIAAAGILLLWAARSLGTWVFQVFLILLVPAGLITWVRAQSGAMTVLQFAASVLFLAVLLPVLLLMSLVIALYLICVANYAPTFH